MSRKLEPGEPAPVVLIVMSEQWPRAGLRAELGEEGYDAIGARGLVEAAQYLVRDPERGPVRLLVVDQDVAEHDGLEHLRRLRSAFHQPPLILVAHVTREPPPGDWTTVLRRPVSVGEIVEAVRRLVPLGEEAGREE